jgi:cytochrome c-type biogenesis protein
VFDISLTFPFTLGLVAAFNPCGFIMLPNYLAYFVGREGDDDADDRPIRNLLRGLKVSLTLSFGFILVFGIFGLATSTIISQGSILEHIGWVTLIAGVAFIPVGVAMLTGWEPKLSTPRLDKGGDDTGLKSMFLFGVSFAVVSLGCTIGLFLNAVIDSFSRDGIIDGSASLLAYALGMSSVIVFLTLSTALARDSVARNMRRILPYVNRISGGLLIVGGIYLILYGWWEIQIERGNLIDSNPLQDRVTDLQTHLQNWIAHVGGAKVGLLLIIAISSIFVWALKASMERAKWRSVASTLLGVYLLLEFVKYKADFVILGLWHFTEGLPERFGNWFTNPVRWGVPLEIIFFGGLALFGRSLIRKAVRAANQTPQDAPPERISENA